MPNAQKGQDNQGIDAIKSKIYSLQQALDDELSIQQPITIRLPNDMQERIKSQHNKVATLSQQIGDQLSQEKLNELIEKIDHANAQIAELLSDKRAFLKQQNQKGAGRPVKGNLSTAFVKMRTRMFLMRMRYSKLSKQLNNLNLHLIYGISSLASKDPYFQSNRDALNNLKFVPRERLGQKAAFALMRLRSSKLLKLINAPHITDNDIKDKFIVSFKRINENVEDDDVRANRLKKFVSMIKQAKKDGKKLSRNEIRSEMNKIKPTA